MLHKLFPVLRNLWIVVDQMLDQFSSRCLLVDLEKIYVINVDTCI